MLLHIFSGLQDPVLKVLGVILEVYELTLLLVIQFLDLREEIVWKLKFLVIVLTFLKLTSHGYFCVPARELY